MTILGSKSSLRGEFGVQYDLPKTFLKIKKRNILAGAMARSCFFSFYSWFNYRNILKHTSGEGTGKMLSTFVQRGT